MGNIQPTVWEAALRCFFDHTEHTESGELLSMCRSLSRRHLPTTTDLVEKAHQDEENGQMLEDAATLPKELQHS